MGSGIPRSDRRHNRRVALFCTRRWRLGFEALEERRLLSSYGLILRLDAAPVEAGLLAVVIEDGTAPDWNTASLENSRPTLTTVDPLSGAEEDRRFTISYDLLADAADASDPDGDEIIFRIESVVSGVLTKDGIDVEPGVTLLSAEESLAWWPDLDANGAIEAFTVRAWDGQAASDSAVSVMVDVAPVNDPPSFTRNGDTTVDEDSGPHTSGGWAGVIRFGPGNEFGQAVQFHILVENDDLFAILPTIDSLTGDLEFESKPNAVGTAIITVWLQDDGGTDRGGGDRSGDETFRITFSPQNDAPTAANPVPDQTTPQGAPFYFPLPADAFEDVDGDVLIYTVTLLDETPLPTWLSFDPVTRTFSGTPSNEDVGTLSVRVLATDPSGELAEDVVQITVDNVNDPPVADPGGPYPVGLGQPLVLDGSGSYDPDAPFGDSIRYYRWDIGELGLWAYSGMQPSVPWQDLTRWPAGTPVTVRLEVTDSLGVSQTTTTELTVPSPVALEPAGSLELPSQDLSAGGPWYRLPAYRDGWLTVESLREDVNVALFDASLVPVQASSPAGGVQRLDQMASAGEVFYIHLSGADGAVDLRITNLVQHSGTNVTVHGTAGDDRFTFDASAGRSIAINGVRYEFTNDQAATFQFDGFDGSDDVGFIGAAGPDNATLRPDQATFNGQGYSLAVANIESIDFDGGEGNDSAYVWGSSGANSYTARPGAGTMAGDGVAITVQAESISARGGGGADTATIWDSPGNDLFEFFSVWGRVTGEGYYHHLLGFTTMIGKAELGKNGDDTAILRGSSQADWLKSTIVTTRMLTLGAWRHAEGFDVVTAYGRGGKNAPDRFLVEDTPGADKIKLMPLETHLTSPTYRVDAYGFGTVEATRRHGGDGDKLTLEDSPGDDILEGNPGRATIRSDDPAYSNTAAGFLEVSAYSTGSGIDRASFSDFVDAADLRIADDRFVAGSAVAELTGPGYRLWARFFDEVRAEVKLGRDTASLLGTDDVDTFQGTASEVSLSGPNPKGSFANFAKGFDEVNAFGGMGQDLAVLTDAVVDQATYGPPADVSLEELAEALWLNEFEKIELWKTGSSEKTELDNIDSVFAWWD